MQKYFRRLITILGGENLGKDLSYTTIVHVLLMLGTGLSSVFISVFLFKMNNSDYILTGKYNAYCFFFEIATFILCLVFYKFKSVTQTMKLGLVFYSLSYIVLLIFRNTIIDYYILVAFLASIGAGLYWTGHYILLKHHTTNQNRQRALGFLGICCYIVSTLASPVSGFLTNYLPDIWGYIAIFVITIICFLIAATLVSKIESQKIENYKINFINSLVFIVKNKGTLLVYLSELARGIRDGITYYYITILLFSAVSNEFIVGLSLMLKNLVSIFSYFYIKNIKSTRQRLMSTVFSLILEIVLLVFLIPIIGTKTGTFIIFIYSFLYMLGSILSGNNSQIPLFDSMTLLVKHCKTDYEYMSIRQLFFNFGRGIGVLFLLTLPTDTIYGVLVIIISSVICLISAILCNIGAKILANEVTNE